MLFYKIFPGPKIFFKQGLIFFKVGQKLLLAYLRPHDKDVSVKLIHLVIRVWVAGENIVYVFQILTAFLFVWNQLIPVPYEIYIRIFRKYFFKAFFLAP